MPHELRQEFEALRQQFIAGLNDRAHKLEQVWNHLHRLNWNEQGIRALQQFLHKLTGSSANYGFMEISSSAQYLSGYLQDMLDLSRVMGHNERNHIDQKIALLKLQMLQASSSANPQELIDAPTLANKALFSGQLVYVIEPDGGHAALLCHYLGRAGFQTRAFESIAQCMEHLHESDPQAILLDADLHPDGLLSIIGSLKAMFSDPVPALLMSARNDAHSRLRALRAGSDDYLIKPINFSLLLEKLLYVLNQPNRTCKVMVVDDDPDMAELEAEILRYAGIEVLCVNRPLQSLEIANSFKPDLVVLDMHMPEMNGIELAKLLRQDPEFLLLPIIFVTAETDMKIHEKIKALGVNALLLKPIESNQLIKLCEQALASTAALKNRVARITQKSHQAHQITPGYFFAAVDEEIHSRNLSKDQSALYYLSPRDYQDITQRMDRIELSTLHEQFCDHLSEILGADENWVDLSPMVACVLAGRRSLQYHKQRSEQLSKHLSQHLYKYHDDTMRMNFNLGMVSLTESLGGAHQALIAAEEAFDLQAGYKTREQKAQSLADAQVSDTPRSLASHTPDVSQLDINKDLALAFQPIISLEETQISHFSVLTRLRRSDGELIPAGQFINRIDKPGKRLELDRWVLQKAVSAMTEDSNTRENATLFVHLAHETLEQKSFFSFIANVLRSSRLRGNGRLVFMLSEPWVTNNLTEAQRITKALLDIGCGSCLTLAGSTPGTCELIQQLPIDYLRLSPKVTAQAYDPAALKALLTQAAKQKLQVIATHIEDSRNLSGLWVMGIRLFEGFFIQPPDSAFHLQNDIVFAKEVLQQNGFNPY